MLGDRPKEPIESNRSFCHMKRLKSLVRVSCWITSLSHTAGFPLDLINKQEPEFLSLYNIILTYFKIQLFKHV